MTFSALPLCIDLDGTLVFTDTFDESVAKTLANPSAMLALLRALPAGKARAKAALARHCRPDPALLPYNEPLIEFLREQRARGRPVVLVTATNEAIAQPVARHLGIFDDVMASSAERNIRGSEKAQALIERYGEGNFVYAGNDHTDLAVWSVAAGAIVVNAPAAVAQAVDPDKIERQFDGPDTHGALAQSARPAHWLKNLFALLPLLVALFLGEPGVETTGFGSANPNPGHAAGAAHLGDASFWHNALIPHSWWLLVTLCLGFAALYLVNDACDLERDRGAGRVTAMATGRFSVRRALLLAAGLGVLALALALWLGVLLPVLAVVVVYLIYTLSAAEGLLASAFVAALLLGRVAIGAQAYALTFSYAGWLALALGFFAVIALLRPRWSGIDET